jgi:eukaryotic-like serine/threonine-protein kinase
MQQLLARRYQLLKLITEKETAILWRALDSQSQKLVVLKFSSPDKPSARERIKQEANAYRALGPIPGLVTFIGYEENDGHAMGPFLALEFLSGATLEEHLSTKGTLSESHALSIGRSVCKVLARLRLYGCAVVHRDISLNNIILLENNEVRVIDLGLALVPRNTGGYEPHDMGFVGTMETRAPEVSDLFAGDVRSDIYSLGRLLYPIIDGRTSEAQKEMPGLDPKTISRVSPALARVIHRCTRDAPSERYQNAQELDQALATIQAKKIVARASRWCGAFLLVGGVVAGAYSFLGIGVAPTPTTEPDHTEITEKSPATMITPTSSLPVPSMLASPTQIPPKEETAKIPQKKVKPTPQEPHQERKTQIDTQEPPAEDTIKQNTPKKTPEEEEEDKELREKLIKYATQPTILSPPKIIEIRVSK